jgi:hypothetical protein
MPFNPILLLFKVKDGEGNCDLRLLTSLSYSVCSGSKKVLILLVRFFSGLDELKAITIDMAGTLVHYGF